MKLSTLALTAALAVSGTAFAQTSSTDTANANGTTATQRADDATHHDFNLGWLGLIGLIGLTGLRKNENRTMRTSPEVVR